MEGKEVVPKVKEGQQDGTQNGHDENATIELLKYIFDPSKERMPELTDVPLNQINPLSWIITFEALTRSLMKYMKYCQDKRHGVETPRPDPLFASETWRFAFYQHRRSIDGSGKMMASTLAMKQLELTELQEEGKERQDW